MTQRDIKKIDKTILDNFYKLVHSQPHVRITAASSTFKILSSMKKSRSDVFNENLNYCIDRLVAGLSSSRALARQGYGTLLLEILKEYQVSTERMFAIAQQKFGHISKETSRDNLLGYFILISVVLESGNYEKSKANSLYLEKVYSYMSQLLKVKSYLDCPICNLLIVHYDKLYSYMLADINPQSFGSDSRLTAFDLLIIILCNKKKPIRELVNLDNAGLMNLCNPLLDSKLQKRPLHPVFAEASSFVIENFPNQFAQFYSKVIFPVFFKPNHNDLASMGLELTSALIKRVNDSNAIKILLNDHLIRILITSTLTRNNLHPHCVVFFESLKAMFDEVKEKRGESDQDEKQLVVLVRFTTSPGSISFDDDTRTSFIFDLLHRSTAEVLKKYMDRIFTSFYKYSSRDQISAARQIAHVVCRPQMFEESSSSLRAAKFLLLNSFLTEVPTDVTNKFWLYNKLPVPDKVPADDVQVAVKNAYHSTLDHIMSVFGFSRVYMLQTMMKFIGYMLDVCEIKEKETTVLLWKKFMNYYGQHDCFRMKLGEMGSRSVNPITYVFFFYGFQIVEHQLECESQLKELEQCAEDQDTSKTWADILTDQLLAILSATECNPWIRKLCESVFGMIVYHITETSITLICDALKAPLDDADVEESESDDEGLSSEEGVEDDVVMGEETASNSEGEPDVVGEESDTDSASENSNTMSEEKKDDEEEEYLDDDQMMKLDSVIADVFKLNKKKSKKSVGAFQLRCLDLVKKLLTKKGTKTDHVTTLLNTLIPLYLKSMKNPETKVIANKIATIVKKMPGKSNYSEQLKAIL